MRPPRAEVTDPSDPVREDPRDEPRRARSMREHLCRYTSMTARHTTRRDVTKARAY